MSSSSLTFKMATPEECGLKQVGTHTVRGAGGKQVTLPLYDSDRITFINTVEGWSLLAKCYREGNLSPYRKAREEYGELHRSDKDRFNWEE